MRGLYDSCSDLTESDLQQLETIVESLPLLADVGHADLFLCAKAGSDIVVVDHAAPFPVPSIYPHSDRGRVFQRNQLPHVFRVLHDGREHLTVSGSLVWGAPALQEVLPVHRARGGVVAALLSSRNLVEHERLQRRGVLFRSMVAHVREQGLRGQLRGAENLGRITEHDGVLIVDKRGIIRYMSSLAENQYWRVGYLDSLMGAQISELDTNEYICFRSMELGVCLERRIEEQDQVWIKRAVPLLPTAHAHGFRWMGNREAGFEGAVLFIQDITEDVRQEQEIRSKSAMIQEVHHRVKNNLQTVASLLRMEARRLPAESRSLLRQSIARVISIAVVHEFLSRGDTADINIWEVCERILAEAQSQLVDQEKRIDFFMEGPRFALPAQQATSFALVMNELLQNAVEHGLSGRAEGRVQISFSETDASMVVEVADDGSGLPPGFDGATSSSLGLRIVQTLVQDDLRGRIQFSSNRGTTVQISFPKELARPAE